MMSQDPFYEPESPSSPPTSSSPVSGPKKNNTLVIVLIVIAVLLLICCCCLVAGWFLGDPIVAFIEDFFEVDLMSLMSLL
jgi:hypothetical protein